MLWVMQPCEPVKIRLCKTDMSEIWGLAYIDVYTAKLLVIYGAGVDSQRATE